MVPEIQMKRANIDIDIHTYIHTYNLDNLDKLWFRSTLLQLTYILTYILTKQGIESA